MRQPEFPVRGSDTVHAFGWGALVASLLIVGIIVGSRGLKDFDPALVSYAGASVFAAFGIGYRYSMWLRRPPTRLYWYRGWQLFLKPGKLLGNIAHLGKIFWNNIFLQRFIEKRSRMRWTAHWFLAWGCLLAAAVTFPLSFGWVRFETARDSQEIYNAFMFGIPVGSFRLGTVVAELTFNILDIAAVMVLIGVFFAMWRRARDRDARSVQQFSNDLLPLIMLFAISITGLFLTASTHLMHGLHYVFLSQLHAITVIFTLLYLPFGKFFHIFQRPAQLGVDFYKMAGAAGVQAMCVRCGQPYGSQMQMEDLKAVQAALGIRYQMADGTHYQDVCPACRRKNIALTQDGLWKARGKDLRGMQKEL
jgi:hypothetical protein